jgi:ribosomal protein S8
MQKVCELIQSLLKSNVLVQRAPYSDLSVQVLSVMQQNGFIRGFVVEQNRINILLKHYLGAPVIRQVTVVSKPSREIFVSPAELKRRTSFNTGMWLVQADGKIMTHREAIEMGVAGKVLLGVNIGSQRWV